MALESRPHRREKGAKRKKTVSKYAQVLESYGLLLFLKVTNAELLYPLRRFFNQREWLREDYTEKSRALKNLPGKNLNVLFVKQLLCKIDSIGNSFEAIQLNFNHEIHGTLGEDGT